MKKNKTLLPLDNGQTKSPWLWLGTWSMGGEGFGPHDERESRQVLALASEKGIRHFDTAGFYAHGKSEQLLQNIIRSDRRAFFISSKGGLVWRGRSVRHRGSPDDLRRQLEESLQRLKTDYLDLFQLHWPDPKVPVSESIAALKAFRQEGLIRFWGTGNFTARQVQELLKKEKDIPHQIHFNPVLRNDKVLAAGSDRCINCVISPLEQGLLGSGESTAGSASIGKKDFRQRNPFFSDPAVLRWNSDLNRLALAHSVSKVSAVLSWICSRPHVHAVIPGPRKVEHLRELLAFRTEVEEQHLCAGDNSNSILSEEKVRSLLPMEIWTRLCQGPDNHLGADFNQTAVS